jgi:hypothetical protein
MHTGLASTWVNLTIYINFGIKYGSFKLSAELFIWHLTIRFKSSGKLTSSSNTSGMKVIEKDSEDICTSEGNL